MRRPSVLVHCARPALDQWYWWVDLDYLRELRAKGFEVDYTDVHSELTWERVRRYDVLVIYVCPLARGAYYDNSPDRPPYRDEFVEIVERFLEAGGGVFLMARSLNADESFRPLIDRWGARIPYERITEQNPRNLSPTPRMGGKHRLWFTDNVQDSPVSSGVEQVWLPLTPHYSAAETMPIEVAEPWQVVLRGTMTSRAVPIDPAAEKMLKPSDALVRPAGVPAPALFAIREYKAGRIAFCAIWPQYSFGQGTTWLYDRRVLERGLDGRPSHFGRLIENSLRWLAQPGPDGSRVGGFTTDPRRLVAPNLRAGAKEEFVRRSRSRSMDRSRELAAARHRARLHRGLIGAQSALGSGSGTIAEYAAAARDSELDFVVFLEDARRLDPEKLERLKERCARQSDRDLQLFPGYTLETNTGNRIFLFGRQVELPPAELMIGDRFNQQYQDPQTSEYISRWSPLIDWLNNRLLATKQVNVGYFGFGDRPSSQRIPDLRLYSMVALRLYSEGQAVEDNLEAYLASAAGTIPPVPAAVHLLRSPAALRAAGSRGIGLTWAQAPSVAALWTALGYADQYAAPNVFASDGPLIEAWPQVRMYYTFAAENFVAPAAYLAAPLAVRSDAGLREIRIYDGDRLFRRFLPGGSKEFELVLELAASVQRNLVLVAEDLDGGRAVSTALRSWKGGGLAPVFCGDRINHCVGAPLLAKGPGRFEVSRTPVIDAGFTWDGGPRGEHPIMNFSGALRPTLVSDRGREGDRGFANLPRLEFADEGAVRVRSVLDTLFDDRIPVVNAWETYGPLGGPSRLLRAEAAFTAFDRPTIGPHPTMYPGFPTQAGASLSLFEQDVVFREDQTVRSLLLFMQWWYLGPFPVTLLHGRAGEVLRTYQLSPPELHGDGPVLERGDWIAVFAGEPSNTSVHINRGEPLRLRFRGHVDLSAAFYAAIGDGAVRRGQSLHFELLSAVDPLDAAARGRDRATEMVQRVLRPSGLRVRRGRAVAGEVGLTVLQARDGAARLRVQRTAPRSGVPLPVRVDGLNPRWSAGVFLHRGYVLGNYGPGRDRYRAAGFDDRGRVWTTLFPDYAEVTEVTIGHPVVCDARELFVQVTLRDDPGGSRAWHVSLNNPTDREIRTTCRAGFDLPGLSLREVSVILPPGGYSALQD